MPTLIAAIDQGTTSSRTLLVSASGTIIAQAAVEHAQYFPQPGYVEHDPDEILRAVAASFHAACDLAGVAPSDITALGITNQRETTVLWDRATSRPLHNAIVWQDTRTRDLCHTFAAANPDPLRHLTGLPLATYFSGPKLRWLLDHVPGARPAAARGELAFGTIDSWLLWNLTGTHATDVTNASRTLLLGLRSLQWEPAALDLIGIPPSLLPQVLPSTHPTAYGVTRKDGPLRAEIPILAILGDQQAALLGQTCLSPGQCKNTYGTGCFLLLNTGPTPIHSTSGLLTTLAYQFHDRPPVYALEGSIAVAGALAQWLRDNLGIVASTDELESLAASVPDSGGVVIVPAFSGLFAPWWDDTARGAIFGLTRHTTRAHIARAALDAVAHQTRDILSAMAAGGTRPTSLKVDGGMTRNALLMQTQADLLSIPVTTSASPESTALGAAYATLIALGIHTPESLPSLYQPAHTYHPRTTPAQAEHHHATWLRAIAKSRGWLDT